MNRDAVRRLSPPARFAVLTAVLALAAWGCGRKEVAIRIDVPTPQKSKTLRIVTYNILAGGETKAGGVENRGELVRSVIERLNPDILGLNECNNWHRDNVQLLRRYEERFDMVGILPIKHGSGVAAFVKRGIPILQVLGDTERQGHGLAIVKVETPDGQPLKVFATHMMHTNPDTRMSELKEITRYIAPGERCIVMGDLNSISGRDTVTLEDVPEDQHGRFAKDGAIHTAVIGGLEGAGLVDVYRHFNPKQGPKDHTVGTKTSTDPAHAKAKLRLDYIFVTRNLIDKVKSIEIINDDETNLASDHFPIAMVMEF